MAWSILSSDFWAVVSKIVFNLSAIILSFIIVLVILPSSIIILTPIYLFRLIISKLVPYFEPSIGKILTTRSTNFSCDEMHKSPECLTIVSLTMEGNVKLEEFRRLYSNILLEKLHNGEIRYPELKQYPVDRFGFKFWKNDTNFDIKSHVNSHKSLNENAVTDSDLWNIRQNLLRKPFKRNLSPWELLIVHNYVPSDYKLLGGSSSGPYSVMYLRIHHCVADGYSILKLLVEGMCGQSIPTNAAPKLPERSKLKRIIYAASFPFRSVFELSASVLLKLIKRTHWEVPLSHRTHGVHSVTNYISIDTVKACKKHYGVSFTSVVLSACGGAMKEIMKRKGLKIPDKVVCVCPFPLEKHPDKLRNFMTQGFIEVPMGSELLTPEMRLKLLNVSYEKLKRSTSPYLNNLLAVAIGGTFTFLAKRLSRTLVPSVIISNFPAAFSYLSPQGYPCLDCFFACGLLNMPGLGFYILSYNGALRVVVVADSSLLSEDEIHEFSRLIEKEISLLETSIKV